MLPLIPKYDALMMANHGAVCYGKDVFKAYFRMETMEHFARIQLVAEMLGGAKALPREEVDKLLDSRTRYGVKAASAGEPKPVLPEGGPPRTACGTGEPKSEEFLRDPRGADRHGRRGLKARGLA